MPAELDALDDVECRRCVQGASIKYPGCIGQWVLSLDLATGHCLAQGAGTNTKISGSLCLVHPASSGTTIFVEAFDLVVAAKRGDTLARPAVTAASRQPTTFSALAIRSDFPTA